MESAPNKRWSLLSSLDTSEECDETLSMIAWAALCIALLQLGVGLLLGWPQIIIDVALMIVCAFFIRRHRSRIAAAVLLAYALLALISITANAYGLTQNNSRNIILALAALWAGTEAVRASWRYHALRAPLPQAAAEQPKSKPSP